MFIGKRTPVNLEELYDKMDDDEMCFKYLNISKVPCLISSPLRKDEHPSFRLKKSRSGAIFYKDYRTGENGSLIDLISKIFGLSLSQTIDKLYYDNIFLSNKKVKIKLPDDGKTSTSEISVKIREFKDYDIDFWGKYGISKEWLEFGDVYAISHLFFTNDGKTYRFAAEKYAYVYVERKDGIITLKVYQPYSSRFKWINKHNNSVWDLWEKLPDNGDKLIITSSRKDALAIWANTGIPSTSLQSENVIPKVKIINNLKIRFKNIYVLFDNDFDKEENVGSLYADKFSDMFSIKKIEIPSEYKSKDPSDLIKNHGVDALKQFIKKCT